jgi:gamma-glutamyltranspeptidase/glutathione hydrolase
MDRWYEILAEVTHAVFRERKHFMLHPRDSTPSLLAQHLSDERVSDIVRRIQAGGNKNTAEADVEEPGETTHLCTADGQGNVVTLTQSIQSLFGAKVANGQLGFLYNNYLSTCKRRQHAYQLGSGCIPLSNVAPTLVLKGHQSPGEGKNGSRCAGQPLLAVGAAGSRRIVSSILHVIAGVIDNGMSLEEAVRLPRIHGLLARKVYIERPAATQTLLSRLEKRFRKVTIKGACSYSMGGLQAIQFQGDRQFVGMADPRRDGVAIGL